MFCSHCGSKIEANYNYCPACGAQLTASDKQNSSQPKEAPTVQKKRMPLWFKLLAALAVIALIGVTAGILFTESLVDVIDNQLAALREDHVDQAYYAYTSKEFQQVTSLEDFREFIAAYPIFVHNQSAHFTQRSIKDNIGTMKGNLTRADHVKVPVEYKLIKEEGKWKVLSIRLLQPDLLKSTTETSSNQELVDVIKKQLEAIKQNHLLAAYQDFASKEFQETTSQDAFQDFVKRYPILSRYDSFSVSKSNVRNNVGIISAVLNMDNFAAYIKYYLVYEDHAWKIWSMRILSPVEEEKSKQESVPTIEKKAMVLSNIKLGTQVNAESIIQNPSTSFKADSGNIYVNVEIANGIKGETIHLNFQHVESHSSIIAKAPIEENGESILVSVFSPPTGGWPKGRYQLIVSSSFAPNQTIYFDIE